MKQYMMKILSELVAALTGISAWIVVGLIGFVLRYFTKEAQWHTIGAWGGLFLCSYITPVVYGKLKKKWVITEETKKTR